MVDALMLGLAMLSSLAGLSWLALGMEVHWNQVYASRKLTTTRAVVLRLIGSLALLTSLLLCVEVDHISMASLVWIMSLAACSILIAVALAWCPRLLAPLVFFLRA